MDIYHYSEITGELLGTSKANPDPLDHGAWLIPAHATNVKPPDHVEGRTRHWIAGGWEYRDIETPEPEPEQAQETDQ